jgi:hypothetical protein
VNRIGFFSLRSKEGFSLLKKTPKEKYSFRKIEMTVDGDKAIMKFRY